MNLHWKRNGFRLQYQMVLSISSEVDALTESERLIVKDAIRLRASGNTMRIVKLNVGSRWAEIIVDADPGIDPTKKVGIIKSDVSSQINAHRGVSGDVPLWVPGYTIASLGSLMDASEQAKELEARMTAAPKGKGRK